MKNALALLLLVSVFMSGPVAWSASNEGDKYLMSDDENNEKKLAATAGFECQACKAKNLPEGMLTQDPPYVVQDKINQLASVNGKPVKPKDSKKSDAVDN